MIFWRFSFSYSFQWNALYKKVINQHSRPNAHGHTPYCVPTIQDIAIPITTSINPDTSISLKYFFIPIPYSLFTFPYSLFPIHSPLAFRRGAGGEALYSLLILRIHTNSHRPVINQPNFHISSKFPSTNWFPYLDFHFFTKCFVKWNRMLM